MGPLRLRWKRNIIWGWMLFRRLAWMMTTMTAFHILTLWRIRKRIWRCWRRKRPLLFCGTIPPLRRRRTRPVRWVNRIRCYNESLMSIIRPLLRHWRWRLSILRPRQRAPRRRQRLPQLYKLRQRQRSLGGRAVVALRGPKNNLSANFAVDNSQSRTICWYTREHTLMKDPTHAIYAGRHSAGRIISEITGIFSQRILL